MKRNRKSKVQHTVLEKRTLQIKSKTVMSWGLRKKIERIFCIVYFVQRKIFYHLCFISMYGVLNTLSEYTYFCISKTLLHALLLLVFKIVESLQCILKYNSCRLFWFGPLHLSNSSDTPDFGTSN